jgi:hypothetical protein
MSVRCTFGLCVCLNFYKEFGALHLFVGQSPRIFVAFSIVLASLGAAHRNIQLYSLKFALRALVASQA